MNHSGQVTLSLSAGSLPSTSVTINVTATLFQFDYLLEAYDEDGKEIDHEDDSFQAANGPAALARATDDGNAWAEELSKDRDESIDVTATLESVTPLN
jgi:hypothetical protein